MKRSIAVLGAFALLVSCSDSGTEPTLNASGSVSFSYNGGSLLSAGSYSASGGLPTSEADQNTRQWAAGVRDTENANNIGVVASVPRPNNRFDLVVIALDRSTAGSSTIDTDNCSSNTCAGMILWYNLSESTSATGEILCGLETGTITLATVSATRATGSFSGTGTCTSADDFTTVSTFTVTNGSFDVPLLSDVPGTSPGLVIRGR